MRDMFAQSPDEMHYELLAERTKYLKTDRHGVMKMCEAMEKLMEEDRIESFQQGLDKGRMEEKKQTIMNLLSMKAKLPFISQVTGWTEEQILRFLHSQGIQPAQ